MKSLRLSAEQRRVLDQICTLIDDGEQVVALMGPAGTGKTSIIEALQNELEDDVVIAATTNKAADVLRRKGLYEAKTVHQSGLVIVYNEPGATLLSYLDSRNSSLSDDEREILLDDFDEQDLKAAWKLARQQDGRILATQSLGIDDFFTEYFSGRWLAQEEPKNAILVVDEASMLKKSELDELKNVYSQIILVGDDMQLPPVGKVMAAFDTVKKRNKICLTKIYRQEKDSQALKLGNSIRNNEGKIQFELEPVEDIRMNLCKQGIPIITWFNKTRFRLTETIRKERGYKGKQPHIGEPIVSRETKKLAGVNFTTNSLWTVFGRDDDGFIIGDESGSQRTRKGISLQIEDYGGKRGAGLFCSYGYAMTCHSAQGSEWPEIMIHAEDAETGMRKFPDQIRKWLYTAVTRSADRVRWVSGNVRKVRNWS